MSTKVPLEAWIFVFEVILLIEGSKLLIVSRTCRELNCYIKSFAKSRGGVWKLVNGYGPTEKEMKIQLDNETKQEMMRIEEKMQTEEDSADGSESEAGSPSAMEKFEEDMHKDFTEKRFTNLLFRNYVFSRYCIVAYVLLTEDRQLFPNFWSVPLFADDIIGLIMTYFIQIMEGEVDGELMWRAEEIPDLMKDMITRHGVFSLCFDILRSEQTHPSKAYVLLIFELFMKEESCRSYLLDSCAMTHAVMKKMWINELAEYHTIEMYKASYDRILSMIS